MTKWSKTSSSWWIQTVVYILGPVSIFDTSFTQEIGHFFPCFTCENYFETNQIWLLYGFLVLYRFGKKWKLPSFAFTISAVSYLAAAVCLPRLRPSPVKQFTDGNSLDSSYLFSILPLAGSLCLCKIAFSIFWQVTHGLMEKMSWKTHEYLNTFVSTSKQLIVLPIRLNSNFCQSWNMPSRT